jgi:hypothetical protein
MSDDTNQNTTLPVKLITPNTQDDNESIRKSIVPFSGKLITAHDSVVIGKNFKTLKNMRYRDTHPISINGMSKINTTAISATYTTWNPSDKGTVVVLSNNNLSMTLSTGFEYQGCRSIASQSTGKWYWELTITTRSTNKGIDISVCNSSETISGLMGTNNNGWSYRVTTVYAYLEHGGIETLLTGNVYVQGDVIGVALDLDNGNLWFSRNGTWINSGNPNTGSSPNFTGVSGTLFAGMACEYYGSGSLITANFGNTTFTYTVPTGFNSGLYSGQLHTHNAFHLIKSQPSETHILIQAT